MVETPEGRGNHSIGPGQITQDKTA